MSSGCQTNHANALDPLHIEPPTTPQHTTTQMLFAAKATIFLTQILLWTRSTSTVHQPDYVELKEDVPEEILKGFECLPCSEWGDSCVADTQCFYTYSPPLQIALLVLSILLLVFILVTALIVAISRKK